MENMMNKAFKNKQNYLNPLTNVYSSKELPSYLNIRSKNNNINNFDGRHSMSRINCSSV